MDIHQILASEASQNFFYVFVMYKTIFGRGARFKENSHKILTFRSRSRGNISDSDSDSDSGLVATTPGDSDSDSDSDSAPLLTTTPGTV